MKKIDFDWIGVTKPEGIRRSLKKTFIPTNLISFSQFTIALLMIYNFMIFIDFYFLSLRLFQIKSQSAIVTSF